MDKCEVGSVINDCTCEGNTGYNSYGEFICCDLVGAGTDRARGALVLGSPQSGDMIMRVADNLFVCLDGDNICAVIADDIFPRRG